MRHPTRLFSSVLALALMTTAGCDTDKSAGAKSADAKSADAKPADAKPADAKPADAKSDTKTGDDSDADDDDVDDDDKGTAKLLLGEDGVEWNAPRARARLKDGKLKISASVQSIGESTTDRRSLTLTIADYNGPGTYEIKDMNSHLTAVSFDFDKVKKAEDADNKAEADKAATKAAADALGGASVMILRGAKIEVTTVTDDFIDGTVVWSGTIAVRGPNKLTGEFHARIKKD